MTITATPETTVTAPAAVATFNVHPAHLDRALRIAQHAASKDGTLPILNTVALALTANGNLVAQATDRYMLAHAVIPTSDDHPTDVEAFAKSPALIPVAALAPLYAWLKPYVKTSFNSLSFNVQVVDMPYPAGTRQLIVTSPFDNTTYTVVLLDGDYPKISQLFRTWTEDSDNDRTALDPAKLEKVTKMAKLGCERNTPMQINVGASGKPVMFRGRADGRIVWEALVMPVRLEGGQLNEETGL